MSHPLCVRLFALVGRRVCLVVAVGCVCALACDVSGQGREVVDAITHGGSELARAEAANLLGIIAVVSMLLAAYFGWLDRSAIQVILNKITQIEGHLRMRGNKEEGSK